jgi:4-diphosphocytidyl-2-C-methyl-D-erythritol kinase
MNIQSISVHGTSLSLTAPAKINWFLKITGKRDDGYHNIITLMQCINLYDNLVFKHADNLEIICDLDIPFNNNIVYKAASLLKKYSSYRKGARIILKKNIPVSAGLGGGSSDAAFTLSGLNKLWGINLNKTELNSIAAEIGSDVPFFLGGPLALIEGKGDRATPFKASFSIFLLLVKPPLSVSTAWAYSCYDNNKSELTKKPVDIKLFLRAFNNKAFGSVETLLDNDLEKVVIEKYPVIGEIKSRMRESGAVIAAMSGSGPTVFGVFDSMEAAKSSSKGFKNCWIAVVQTII